MYLEHWLELIDRWEDSPASCRNKVMDEILYGRGIPVAVRRKLWLTASGAIRKSQKFPHTYENYLEKRNSNISNQFEIIEMVIRKDIGRTFPLFFDRNASSQADEAATWKQHEQSLYNVLCAIALSNEKVGYHQGLNFITALVLIVLHENESKTWQETEVDTFWVMQSVLQDFHLQGLFQCKSSFLQQYIDQFDVLFRRYLPALRQHLDRREFPTQLFALEWFTTVFAYSLRLDAVYLIWDLFLVARLDECLFITGLSILQNVSAKLLKAVSFEQLVDTFKYDVKELAARDLCKSIRLVVQRIVPSALIPPGKSTLLNIERAIHDITNPMVTTEYSATSLLKYVQYGDSAAIVQELAKYSFPERMVEMCIFRAAFLGHDGVVEALVHNRDPTCPGSLAKTQGMTPLHVAALCGHISVARVLIASGMDRHMRASAPMLGKISEHREYGWTALDIASSFSQNSAIVKLLEGEVCLKCETLLEDRSRWWQSPNRNVRAPKDQEWDGDYCESCKPKKWFCKHCKDILREVVKCRRCKHDFCTTCAFTRRKLLPEYSSPVPVCNNCHHVLRSCPCLNEEDAQGDLRIFCDHSSIDYATGQVGCTCKICEERRYSLKSPMIPAQKLRYDRVPMYPLHLAILMGYWDRSVRSSILYATDTDEIILLEGIREVEHFLYECFEVDMDPIPESPRNETFRDFRAELIEFYSRWNPSRVTSVDVLLEKHKGSETTLLDDLRRMYASSE